MKKKTFSKSILHELPLDMIEALSSDQPMHEAWENITPIARNEWICWIESAKKTDTRIKRLRIARENLVKGIKRPCCWPGCPHR
jgi:uncharacterized protein YdeI (YjbR/CyaY-like superfamily)